MRRRFIRIVGDGERRVFMVAAGLQSSRRSAKPAAECPALLRHHPVRCGQARRHGAFSRWQWSCSYFVARRAGIIVIHSARCAYTEAKREETNLFPCLGPQPVGGAGRTGRIFDDQEKSGLRSEALSIEHRGGRSGIAEFHVHVEMLGRIRDEQHTVAFLRRYVFDRAA